MMPDAESRGSDRDGGEEVSGQRVVAGRDGAVMFAFVEEARDPGSSIDSRMARASSPRSATPSRAGRKPAAPPRLVRQRRQYRRRLRARQIIRPPAGNGGGFSFGSFCGTPPLPIFNSSLGYQKFAISNWI